METRVQLQPAYVIHSQPFRNTSLLVDFFCMDYGRVRAVAKGARREKSRYRSMLQLFQPVLISFTGRGEVKTLGNVECSVGAIKLHGKRLFSGLYINELLTRLLLNHDEHKPLYNIYQDTLIALQGEADMEPLLREFELKLLAELGYGINLEVDCSSREPIVEEQLYRFVPDVGFQQAEEDSAENAAVCYQGRELLALRNLDLADASLARAAKRLLRQALSAHLGERPLHSRNLFTTGSSATAE